MPFTKNDENINRNGRPKGAANRNTNELKELIKNFVFDNIEQIEEDLNSLEPKERLEIMVKLMGFVLPRPNKHEIESKTIQPKIIVQNEETKRAIERLGNN